MTETATGRARTSAGSVKTRPRTGGPWLFAAHRITGVMLFFFVVLHVLDTVLLRVSPQSYDQVVTTYTNPFFAVLEVLLVGAVLFHLLNGLRLLALDTWPAATRRPAALLWTLAAVWVLLMVPAGVVMLRHTVATWFGSA